MMACKATIEEYAQPRVETQITFSTSFDVGYNVVKFIHADVALVLIKKKLIMQPALAWL